uniref:Su(S)_1 protein n=1 Tax=Fopius arisanus TaxID=64838 RepID=A0A0C9QSU3_9HYME
MALESVTAAERLIQRNCNAANDDLEDGEIPSDEDDEPLPPPTPVKAPDPAKSSKSESHRDRNSESKSSKSKSKSSTSTTVSGTGGGKSDRFTKYKNPSEDWAGDVEKAIKAALDGDNNKEEKSKGKGSSSRSKNRKRSRDEKEEERNKDQKKRRLSEDENGNEDEDEFMFVRGASPINRKDLHDGSPPRRSHENDNFDNNSDRDSEERSNRHRDEKRVSNRGSTPRRSGKNERTGKNKGRGSARNERNGRRNQITDHNQDPDSICLYFMQGKCHRGDDCPFSHNALPPRKMELCKFYLMDCCAKRDKCLYMHHDFPCKFHHTGLKCGAGSNCKFSHEPLNDQVKNILLKHLETAPKEILGDFPRLSRESALMMINHTARNHSQGLEDDSQKIPSLFDVSLTSPNAQGNTSSTDKDEDLSVDSQKRSNSSKEKKSANKKTRWGSDDDRVPLEQIVLLQTVNQLGLNLPNVALSLAMQQHQQMQQRLLIQQCIAANMDFYNEIQGNVLLEGKTKLTDGLKDSEELTSKSSEGHLISKDIDLRQLLANAMPKTPRILSLAEEAANLSKSKFDEESDREEESNLVIEVPVEEDDKNKDLEVDKKCKALEDGTNSQLDSRDSPVAKLSASGRETSTNLPKTAQEIFLRIQQQQKAAGDTLITSDEKLAVENALKDQEEWYSDESDRDNAAAAATAAAAVDAARLLSLDKHVTHSLSLLDQCLVVYFSGKNNFQDKTSSSPPLISSYSRYICVMFLFHVCRDLSGHCDFRSLDPTFGLFPYYCILLSPFFIEKIFFSFFPLSTNVRPHFPPGISQQFPAILRLSQLPQTTSNCLFPLVQPERDERVYQMCIDTQPKASLSSLNGNTYVVRVVYHTQP